MLQWRRVRNLWSLTSRLIYKIALTGWERNASQMASAGLVEAAIHRKIVDAFDPVRVSIENDSARHAGHAAMKDVPTTEKAESHFKYAEPSAASVEVVSSQFEGKKAVERHRMVYSLLQEEFDAGLHALSLKLFAPSEVH